MTVPEAVGTVDHSSLVFELCGRQLTPHCAVDNRNHIALSTHPNRAVDTSKYRPAQRTAVKEYQRKQLLERVGRDGSTVGTKIPDAITVQGEQLDLRTFVFEINRRETIPPGDRDRVETAKRNLRRERVERLEQIEDGEISYAEGEQLAESIIGIDRALNALDQLEPVDLEAEAERKSAADQKRWTRFLQKALGHDDANSRNRR